MRGRHADGGGGVQWTTNFALFIGEKEAVVFAPGVWVSCMRAQRTSLSLRSFQCINLNTHPGGKMSNQIPAPGQNGHSRPVLAINKHTHPRGSLELFRDPLRLQVRPPPPSSSSLSNHLIVIKKSLGLGWAWLALASS